MSSVVITEERELEFKNVFRYIQIKNKKEIRN